jgi:large subunit ribosomal protein L7/L12
MAQKIKDLSSQIAELSLLEAAELVKVLEEVLGVSAAAPMMMAAAPGAPAPSAEDEKTEFDVILVNGGSKKIEVIKEIRTITGLGLKEAKEAAEGSNVVIKSGIAKNDALAIAEKLKGAGAEIKVV